MEDVLRHPVSSVSERYFRLGLNAYQGNKLKEKLLQRDLVVGKDLPIPTGRIKVLELMAKGKETLERLGITTKQSKRKGGIEHEYWKKKVAGHFRSSGYRVIEEYPLGGGKAVDLLAEKEGKRIGIEIETGKSQALYNVHRAFQAGLDAVLMVGTSRPVQKKLLEAMVEAGWHPGANLKVVSVETIFQKSGSLQLDELCK